MAEPKDVRDAAIDAFEDAVREKARLPGEGVMTDWIHDEADGEIEKARANLLALLDSPTAGSNGCSSCRNFSWDRADAAMKVMDRLGYRFCDIPACNCGDYHAPTQRAAPPYEGEPVGVLTVKHNRVLSLDGPKVPAGDYEVVPLCKRRVCWTRRLPGSLYCVAHQEFNAVPAPPKTGDTDGPDV